MKYSNAINMLEHKFLNELDYLFLNEIKHLFPYNNAYFIVCLAEVINESINNGEFTDHNTEAKDLISLLKIYIEKAKYIYLNSNISEILHKDF